MKIIISEEQYNHILNEQVNYQCFPEFSDAIDVAINIEKIPPIFVKAGLAILGRESDFGKVMGNRISKYLPSKYVVKAGPEYLLNVLSKNQFFQKKLSAIMKKVSGKDNWVPSMGMAQMTPDVAEKYNVNLRELMSKTGSLIAASSYIRDLYTNLNNFDTNVPSVILSNNGVINNPSSTGNARLDASIVSYNIGMNKLRQNYCQTNSPTLLGPCSLDQYKPYPTSNPNFVLTVSRNKMIKNYIPLFKTGEITTYGYLKEVKNNMARFTCF